MNTEALYLAEIVGYDPALGTTRTIRVANRAFRTKPSEAPANTPYEVCLQQPTDISRSLFAPVATRGRSTMSLGNITLLNPDGQLDYLSDLAFDTRSVTVRRTTKFNPSYPADFTTFVATMEQPEWDTGTITLKLRDVFYNVASAPLQTNKYLGNNALPAGLEGTAELAGKSKPVCLGVARMVPAPCVNTSKLIYQVNDGAVNSIDAVRDRGVALLPGRTWSTPGTPHASTPRHIAYGNGVFVIGYFDGTIYTSPDGITWTLKQSLGSTNIITGLAYNGTNWIALAEVPGTTTAYVSSNNFTSVASHVVPSSPDFLDLFYHASAGLFVGLTSASTVITTPDGVTWTTQATLTGIGSNPRGIYANGIGVAVGGDRIYSSPDAITWTQRLAGAIVSPASYVSVAFGNGRFVVISGPNTAISQDGIVWEVANSTAIAGFGTDVTFSGVFIAASTTTTNVLRTSVDGFIWTDSPANVAGTYPLRMTANGFQVVAVDGSGKVFYTSVASYSSTADVLDDTKAPMPGEFISYLGGGYVRLGSSPDAQPLFDVTQGATTASRAAAGLAAVVLARVPGAPTFNSGDLTTLAALTSAPLGYWTMDDGVTCDALLDQIAATIGAAWYPDKSSAFRIAQFAAPSGTPALTLTKSDIKAGTLQRIASNDQGNGIPLYQVVMQYARYYQTITTDIAGAVSDADRADFAQEWRNAPSTDLSVLTAHPSAGVLTIQSLFAVKSDAQTEADRQLALRKVKRDPYELTIELNDESDALDLNGVIEIVHPRYSLSVIGSASEASTGIGAQGGGLFRILDARPNAEAKELTLTVWGGARYKNLVDANGAYVTDSNGAYVVAGIAA